MLLNSSSLFLARAFFDFWCFSPFSDSCNKIDDSSRMGSRNGESGAMIEFNSVSLSRAFVDLGGFEVWPSTLDDFVEME